MSTHGPRQGALGTAVLLGVVLLALVCVECWSSARTYFNQRPAERRFPYDYVSKGLWSFAAYVRPLDRDSADFEPIIRVARGVLDGENALYRDFSSEGSSYVYPPPTAVLFIPFALIAEAWGTAAAVQTVDALGRLCVLALLAVALIRAGHGIRSPLIWLLLLALLIAFYPLRWMLMAAQIQPFIALALVGALLAYERGRCGIAGALIGCAVAMKPYLAPLLAFALVRRNWPLAAAMTFVPAAAVVLSCVCCGIQPWVTYLQDVLPEHSLGYGYTANYSVTGLILRWTGVYAFGLVAADARQRLIAFALSATLVVLSAWPRAGTNAQATRLDPTNARELRSLDLAIAALAVTLASPIAWEHYFAWLIVPFAVMFRVGQRLGWLWPWWLLLAASYVLLGSYWKPSGEPIAGPLSLLNAVASFGGAFLGLTAWRAQAALAPRRVV